jgi:aerobic carbon-monoxide dehydrogenase medium subunit
VIPASFAYARPGSLGEAVELLAAHDGDAKLLAGGQSLIPLLKLRLSVPALLLDIGRLSDLAGVRDQGDHLAIGALTRHHDLARDPLVRQHAPLLAHAAGQVGDPQVRHRGTLGGSLTHADPAGDLPAVVLAYEATTIARGPRGERAIPAAELFTGFLESALAPDEVLCEVRVPKLGPAVGWSFQKFTRRAIDWATVGVAALLDRRSSTGDAPRSSEGTGSGDGAVREYLTGGPRPGLARVALINMGPTPLRAPEVEARLQAGASPAQAAGAAAEDTDPTTDAWASSWYRQQLARVLVRRALEAALSPRA